MPYKPTKEGLDYYKSGLSAATGDGRWLKLNQSTPQTVSGGAPIFSSGFKISGVIIDTRTTEDTALPLVTARNDVTTGMFYQHGSALNRDFLDWYLRNNLMFRIARNADGTTPGVTFFAPFTLSGYTLFGHGASGGNLTLVSADAGTKGKIYFGAALTNYYDEANNTWQLGSASLNNSGNCNLGTIRTYTIQTPTTTALLQQAGGTSPIEIATDGTLDAYLFYQTAIGRTPKFRQYGYITAGTANKYAQWQVNDTTDNFELTRQDANILAFDIQMPLIASNITAATINTGATQDLKLFDTGTLADNVNGRVLQIVRKATTAGTQTLTIGTDQFGQSYFWTNTNSIFASYGSGVYDQILWRNLNTEFQIQHQALGDITFFNSDIASIANDANGKSLWIYRKANEGTDSLRLYIGATQEGSISASGVLVIQSGGSGVLALRTAIGSSVLLGDTGGSDVGVGSPWMYEGDKNPILTHYGYVTTPAAIKNVSFNLSSDGVYYIGRQDTTIDHMQINMPLGLNFPNDTYGELKLQKASVDSTHIMYSFSHRSNNKDLWLYAYDGTNYKNFIQCLWDAAKIDFGSNDVNTGSTSNFYFGDSATDGTWKIVRSGNNLSFQRRESGSYVEKGKFQP